MNKLLYVYERSLKRTQASRLHFHYDTVVDVITTAPGTTIAKPKLFVVEGAVVIDGHPWGE